MGEQEDSVCVCVSGCEREILKVSLRPDNSESESEQISFNFP